MADKRISQLVDRGTVANNDVVPIVVSGATTTNKATISSIQTFMQGNLDLGVTSVGITLGTTGTNINVTGSPVTSSGNITINIPTASATNRGALSSADWSTFNSKVSSVGLSMPSAFSVANSPITGSGTIAVTGAGTVSQYVRGDGSLADFPQGGGGGGASVNYYLNGSVSQGTIGGIAYLEMNKTPILGAGTDFTIAADGYIASFITDAGDPGLLEIPGGNWNFETYFQASSSGGTPSFYVELYKVNSGGTATLIASNSANPELIAFGTTTTPYFSTLAVPTTVLTITDRLALRYYVTHSGRTITLHTENGNLCQIITTFTTGLTALNGLTAQVQNFATGTSGTDFAISSATSTHTFNLPTASASNRGALSSADWTTFNNKTSNLGTVTSVGLSSATSGVFIGTTPITTSGSLSFTIATASGSQNGLLSSTDWTTFNGKQAAGNYVTLDTAQTITALKTFNTSSVEMAIFNSTFATGGVLAFSRNGVGVGNIGNSGSLTVGILDDLEIRSGSAKKIHLRTDATQFTLSPSGGATLFSANSSTPLLILNTTGTNQPSGIGTQQNGADKWAFGTNFGSGDDSWNVYNYAAATRFLTIASTGAATFSSSVTATAAYIANASITEGATYFDIDTFGGKKLRLNNAGNQVIMGMNGNVGVGTLSPSYRFQVNSPSGDWGTYLKGVSTSSSSYGLLIDAGTNSNDTAMYIRNAAGSSAILYVGGHGNVGIGTAGPQSRLQINSPGSTLGLTGDAALRIAGGTFGTDQIVFGYSEGGGYSPAVFGYIATTATGYQYGDLFFATRSVTSNTAPTERMRITSGGYLKASNNGVYNNATGTFHELTQNLNGASSAILTHGGTSDPYGLEVNFTGHDPNNATNYMFGAYKTSGGFVWIYRIFSNGTVSARSDARWKKNIETTRNGYIEDLCKLRVVKYNWYNHEDDAPKELGLIAQEVEEVFPNLIQIDPVIAKREVEQEDGSIIEEEFEDGVSRSIKTSVLPFMLLKAIQEQQAQIEELKVQIDSLKNQIK